MPRTPAPLTVGYEHIGKTWDALDEYQNVVGRFYREADARAFVALPALIEALKAARQLPRPWMDGALTWPEWEGIWIKIEAALAQADGPSQEQG